MYLPKHLCIADVMHALRFRQYRTASAISINLIRNKLNATNSMRRSKWYLR
jgi:hypothetical protein